MIDLDDAAAIARIDAGDMLGAVARLGEDAATSYAAGSAIGPWLARPPSSVLVCGMGGSAVAGDLLRALARDAATVPVEVNRSHGLPAYAGGDTLVIVSSYSGETSETLSAFGQALERGCSVMAVTSGGTLASRCDGLGLPVVLVPGGGQPRAALGHLGFAIVGAMEAAGFLPPQAGDVAETVAALAEVGASLGPAVPEAANHAKQTASWIGDRVPVVWGADGAATVAAMRWKTQLNENGKVPAWWASMSELDHNEVVGWVEPYGARHAIVALRLGDEHPEIDARFDLTAGIVRDAGAEVREVRVAGGSLMRRMLEAIMVGDLVSCYVGLRRGVDPTPVEVITRLKAALVDT